MRARRVRVRGDVSSQFLTALLMALPLHRRGRPPSPSSGELISKPYVEITLNTDAPLRRRGRARGLAAFTIPAGARYRSPGELWVEGDASSASYFLAAGAIGGGPVRVEGVGRASIQGDVRFADALAQMGARIAMGENWIEASAPAGGKLRAIDVDFNHIPDAAMTLAVAALFADGTSTLRNIGSWRVKETDRIAAMATELRKLGATVEEGADFLRITPPASGFAPGVAIDTYDDHRMAMCFSLAALGRRAGAHQRSRSACARPFPTISTRWRGFPAEAGDDAKTQRSGDRHRRPVGLGQGHGRRSGVAEALGFHFLDSGALYRLVALAALRAGVALDDEAGAGRAGGRARRRASTAETYPARRRRRHRRDPQRGRAASAPRGSPPCPAVRAALLGAPAGLPPAPGPGRRRPRHGHGGVPGRAAQGVPDRERRSARRAPV